MLFNSYEFLFLFLPAVFSGYFFFTGLRYVFLARVWLVVSSLFFYSYWDIRYFPLIVSSIVFNFLTGSAMLKYGKWKKILLFLGITFNLSILGYYKYFDFVLANLNAIFSTSFPLREVTLPLGISFFTFQQIAYLVDTYRGEVTETRFFDYALFVSFFPQLIAGPIVHHKEMMPQFRREENWKINLHNIALGIFIFSTGLFKKVIFADTLGQLADAGYATPQGIKFLDAWAVSIAFVLQIYFDFSGYSDMAVGLGKLFNIHILWNFDSPFKTTNIQELWRKWHISLSRFLRDYVYFPLGGSRVSEFRTNLNLFLTFVIGGIWHGAGWTYIIWGGMTGAGIIFHRYWERWKIPLPRFLATGINFLFFVTGSVFFRAASVPDALEILKGMFGFHGFLLPEFMKDLFPDSRWEYSRLGMIFLENTHTDIGIYLLAGLIIVFTAKNTRELATDFRPNMLYLLSTVFLLFVSIINLMNINKFLYFNF